MLSMRGICKSFFGVPVLHGVSYDIVPGEVLGLVGENGSGKSTSMNILGGVLRPDAGTMTLDGAPYAPASPHDAARAGVAFMHQELNLFANLTVEENVFIDGFPHRGWLPLIDRRAIRRRTEALLREVDLAVSPGTPVARLSQGERQLVEIAKALARDAHFIVFDEPTTSLTGREVERLFAIIGRLRARGIGMVYVSHVLGDVLALCERVTVLRDGLVVGGGARAEFHVGRIISLMVGRLIDSVFPARAAVPTDEVVLAVAGLSQPGVADAITFEIRAGEVVGLAGLMGSGRSELARMIFGLDPFAAGSVSVGGRRIIAPTPTTAMQAGIAFLTEDRRGEGLLMEASIVDNITLVSLREYSNRVGLVRRKRALLAAAAAARSVRLSTTWIGTARAKHLSGGNQQKVVLGKWLMRSPRLFILDEPTRGIDVGAKQEVYRIINSLVEAGGAVLLISSEIEEVIGLSDRIFAIARGALTDEFHRGAFDREAIMAAATPAGGAAHAARAV